MSWKERRTGQAVAEVLEFFGHPGLSGDHSTHGMGFPVLGDDRFGEIHQAATFCVGWKSILNGALDGCAHGAVL